MRLASLRPFAICWSMRSSAALMSLVAGLASAVFATVGFTSAGFTSAGFASDGFAGALVAGALACCAPAAIGVSQPISMNGAK